MSDQDHTIWFRQRNYAGRKRILVLDTYLPGASDSIIIKSETCRGTNDLGTLGNLANRSFTLFSPTKVSVLLMI